MANKIAIKIYFDDETGEVERVDCTKRFDNEGPLFKMDVLQDSIEALISIYHHEKSQLLGSYTERGEA